MLTTATLLIPEHLNDDKSYIINKGIILGLSIDPFYILYNITWRVYTIKTLLKTLNNCLNLYLYKFNKIYIL